MGSAFVHGVGKPANDDHRSNPMFLEVLEKLERAQALINSVLVAVEYGSDEVDPEDIEQLASAQCEIRSVSTLVRAQIR